MPTIGIKKALLFDALGKVYTEEEFDELCFEFGLELDEVVKEVNDEGKEEEVYKIEIGANRFDEITKSNSAILQCNVTISRYDLLCLEGLVRALLVFQGKMSVPRYSLSPVKQVQQLILEPSVLQVRPHVIGAVLRGVTFNKARYNSFIDLQDKLHQNLARKRTLASVGTHDLDTIKVKLTSPSL